MSDPRNTGPKREVEEYKQRDPVEVVKRTITDKKMATEQKPSDRSTGFVNPVDESVKFAEESAFPTLRKLPPTSMQSPTIHSSTTNPTLAPGFV